MGDLNAVGLFGMTVSFPFVKGAVQYDGRLQSDDTVNKVGMVSLLVDTLCTLYALQVMTTWMVVVTEE